MKFKKEKEKRLRDVHQLVLSKTGEKKGLSAAKLYFAHFLVGPESSTSLVYAHNHRTITTIEKRNIPIPLQSFLLHLCDSPLPPPPATDLISITAG